MKKRFVYVFACHPSETQGVALSFRRYGVGIRQLSTAPTEKEARELLTQHGEDEVPLGVLRYDTVPTLKAWTYRDESLSQRNYELGCIKGQLSAPELLTAEFITERLYYRKRINLRWNTWKARRSIDFEQDPALFLKSNPLLNNPIAHQYGVAKLYHAVINRGIFFRAAKNRREKNYWNPGLNAGIPLVPKRDQVHEITFMAHDLGHFMIPDLIFTGQDTPATRQLYIVYRMMSEAMTLVLADMVFVNSLVNWGWNYDYSRRRIHPLFGSFGIDLTDSTRFLEHLKTLLHASVSYCLRGRDDEFRALIAQADSALGESALAAFKEKYMPFFVEDFNWTHKNYSFFQKHTDAFEDWWQAVSPLRSAGSLELETIHEFAQKLHPRQGDLIEQVFHILSERIIGVFQAQLEGTLPFCERLKKALCRYSMGQSMLFTRYGKQAPEILALRDQLISRLCQSASGISVQEAHGCRALIQKSIDQLYHSQLITLDDALTFSETFPIFEPEYAHYDEEKGYYCDLAEESERILALAIA